MPSATFPIRSSLAHPAPLYFYLEKAKLHRIPFGPNRHTLQSVERRALGTSRRSSAPCRMAGLVRSRRPVLALLATGGRPFADERLSCAHRMKADSATMCPRFGSRCCSLVSVTASGLGIRTARIAVLMITKGQEHACRSTRGLRRAALGLGMFASRSLERRLRGTAEPSTIECAAGLGEPAENHSATGFPFAPCWGAGRYRV